jgi:hypothetical protein
MVLTVGKTAATVGGARALGLGALMPRRHKILTPIHKDIAKGGKTNRAVHGDDGGGPLSRLAISRIHARSIFSAPSAGAQAIVPRNLLTPSPFMVSNAPSSPAPAYRGSYRWGALLLAD